MMWVFVIFLLIQVIGYPVLGIRFILSLFKKEWSKFKVNSIRLLALFVFSGFVFSILPGSQYFWWPFEAVDSLVYTKKLMDVSFILPEPIYEIDSDRAFNGDGRSLAVYKLNESVIQKMIAPDTSFFDNYPKNGMRDGWQIEKWTKTPLLNEHKEAFRFAAYANNSSEFDLDELLTEEGNYYAYSIICTRMDILEILISIW